MLRISQDASTAQEGPHSLLPTFLFLPPAPAPVLFLLISAAAVFVVGGTPLSSADPSSSSSSARLCRPLPTFNEPILRIVMSESEPDPERFAERGIDSSAR